MKTRVTGSEEFQKILIETLLNKTNKVSKVSDNSTTFGLTLGNAKIAQKAVKDIALIETQIFLDDASGSSLDSIAEEHGISPRFEVSKSGTYLRIVADPGTVYTVGVNTFSGTNGIVFDLEQSIVVGEEGFIYARVKSQESGQKTNVQPASITSVSPKPQGHKYVVNEFLSIGGRDLESDELFKARIKNSPNINAQKTLSFLEQLFTTVNQNILRVFFYGYNKGKTVLGIVTQNGVSLTENELNSLYQSISERISLTDLYDVGQSLGIELKNADYWGVDFDFRVGFSQNSNLDFFRQNVQLKIQQKFDYRYWTAGDLIDWGDFYSIINSTPQVQLLPSKYFKINGGLTSIQTSKLKLPRVRSFVMRDLEGTVLSANNGNLLPVFYPSNPNQAYISTVI